MGVEFDETGEAMRRKCDFCACPVLDPQISGQIVRCGPAQADIPQGPLVERVQFSCPALRCAAL
jgi:hypothetical protein